MIETFTLPIGFNIITTFMLIRVINSIYWVMQSLIYHPNHFSTGTFNNYVIVWGGRVLRAFRERERDGNEGESRVPVQ